MKTTILLDIKIEELENFYEVDKVISDICNKESIEKTIKDNPFLLFKKRIFGENMVTLQMPLNKFFMYANLNLVYGYGD